MTATQLTRLLPAPAERLLELGLTEEQLEDAVSRAPDVRGFCPWEADGAYFSVPRARKVLASLGLLRHTKTRRYEGRPLVPDPWQVVWFLAPVFGWLHERDDTRVVRESLLEVPRKNGKTTLSSGLSAYLTGADGEPGAEVYSAAVGRDGAQAIVNDTKNMILRSPDVRAHFLCQARIIKHPLSNSIFRALSKLAEAAHGLNVHGAVIDELHVHKDRALVDAIVSGTGSRDQPLIIVITTADEGGEHTIYVEWHERAEKQHNGVTRDPAFYGVVWRAHEEDDPLALETVRKANPGYGTALNPDVVRGEIEKARSTPSYLPTYLRLRLNIRRAPVTRLLTREAWRHADQIQLHPELDGRTCYGGFDLSSTTDFTAAALLFPPDDPDQGMFDVLTRIWVPEDRLEALEHACQVPLAQWRADGWIHTTEGDVVDYRPVRQWFGDADRRYALEWIGYDRWNAGETVNEMQDYGHNVEPVGQGYASMSAPLKLLLRLALQHRLRHAGHPVLTWMALALTIRRDESDNMRPVKPDRDKSANRIDGMSALLNALYGYQTYGAAGGSVYEDRGMETA